MAAAPTSGGTFWSSRFAFIMAAVGSSVGLGNLWRFSAEAGRGGGGAFILMYIVFVLIVGIPVLMSEFMIGRDGKAASAINSVKDVAKRSGQSERWSILGVTGMVASFLIVSFYCVVAAWVMMYIPKFLFGGFNGLSPADISAQFGASITDPWTVLPFYTAFALLTVWLVARGVNRGIEWASTILMPMFFVLLILLSLYSLISGFDTPISLNGEQTNGSAAALGFLFKPDFGAITPTVMTAALGQAFFSIGLGSAIMITYASYLPEQISIPKSALTIGLTDTFVAIIAGLAIFPIVFSHGLDVNSGAGLFFETLPVALSSVKGGTIIGGAFFFLAIFAAVTSSISLMEPSVAWVQERFNISRIGAAIAVGALMWIIGLNSLGSLSFLDFLDKKVTGAVLLPLTGLLTVIFVGWKMKRSLVDKELGDIPTGLEKVIYFLIRFVAPIAIFLVLFLGIDENFFGGWAAQSLGLVAE